MFLNLFHFPDRRAPPECGYDQEKRLSLAIQNVIKLFLSSSLRNIKQRVYKQIQQNTMLTEKL
jgi:hypothetical protein